MSDRPTPTTDGEIMPVANGVGEWMHVVPADFARDLERKLAEALEKSGPEETWRADAGWKRADEAETKLAEAREALEAADKVLVSHGYGENGQTRSKIKKALARIDANQIKS